MALSRGAIEVVVKLSTAKSAEPVREINGVPVRSSTVQPLFLIVNDFDIGLFVVPKSVLSAISGVVSPFVISIAFPSIVIPCVSLIYTAPVNIVPLPTAPMIYSVSRATE